MASFMKETWRRTACPSEAIDCSAARSGSASLMATSVMVDDLSRSSSARQDRSASSHSTAIGTAIAVKVKKVAGRDTRSNQPWIGASEPSITMPKAAPMAAQTTLPMAAYLKTAFDGFCCSAKIRPPMLGPSSLAAMRLREGPAGRRRATRRRGVPSSSSVSASSSGSGARSTLSPASGSRGGDSGGGRWGPEPLVAISREDRSTAVASPGTDKVGSLLCSASRAPSGAFLLSWAILRCVPWKPLTRTSAHPSVHATCRQAQTLSTPYAASDRGQPGAHAAKSANPPVRQ